MLVVLHMLMSVLTVSHIQLRHAEASVYCTGELFDAVCNSNQVLVIEKAIYGREKKDPKCVKSDMGLNCYADVIMQLDHQCSGKQSCEVIVGPADISVDLPCRGENILALNVQYSCTKVREIPSNQRCERPIPISIRDNVEILSSTKAPAHCDLNLEAPAGRGINVTLIDFNWDKTSEGFGCSREYGTLTEEDKEIKVCGGGPKRLSTVYTTGHNEVKLQWSMRHSSNFLLQVNAMTEEETAIWINQNQPSNGRAEVGKQTEPEEDEKFNMRGLLVITGGCIAMLGACVICSLAIVCLIKERGRSNHAKARAVKSPQQVALLSHRASAAPSDLMQASMHSSYMHPLQDPSIQRVQRPGHARTRSLMSDSIIVKGGHARTRSTASSIVLQDMRTSMCSAYDYPDDEFSVYYDDVADDWLPRGSRYIPGNSMQRNQMQQQQPRMLTRAAVAAVQYRNLPPGVSPGDQSPRVQSFTFPNMHQSACSGYEDPIEENVEEEPANPLPIPRRAPKNNSESNTPVPGGTRVQSFSTFPGMQQSACSGYEEIDEDEVANPLPIPKRGLQYMSTVGVEVNKMQTSVCSGYELPMEGEGKGMNRMPGDGGETPHHASS